MENRVLNLVNLAKKLREEHAIPLSEVSELPRPIKHLDEASKSIICDLDS